MPGLQEQRIQRLRHACGCAAGMVVMLICVAAYVVHDVQTPSHAGAVQRLLIGVGIALGGAMVGKLAGLLWAHFRLTRLLRQQARAGG